MSKPIIKIAKSISDVIEEFSIGCTSQDIEAAHGYQITTFPDNFLDHILQNFPLGVIKRTKVIEPTLKFERYVFIEIDGEGYHIFHWNLTQAISEKSWDELKKLFNNRDDSQPQPTYSCFNGEIIHYIPWSS